MVIFITIYTFIFFLFIMFNCIRRLKGKIWNIDIKRRTKRHFFRKALGVLQFGLDFGGFIYFVSGGSVRSIIWLLCQQSGVSVWSWLSLLGEWGMSNALLPIAAKPPPKCPSAPSSEKIKVLLNYVYHKKKDKYSHLTFFTHKKRYTRKGRGAGIHSLSHN